MSANSVKQSSENKLEWWDITVIIWFLTDSLFNHQTLSIVGLVLFVACSLFKTIANHKQSFNTVLFLYAVFLTICYYNHISGNTISPTNSARLMGALFRNAIFFYFIYQYMRVRSFEVVVKVFFYVAVLGSIFMLLLQRSLTGGFVMRDAGGLNGNSMAIYNALVICMLVVKGEARKKRNIIIILFLLLFCVLAGTRKAIIALCLGLGMYYSLKNPSKIIGNVSKLLVLFVIIYFVLMEIPFIYDLIGNRFESLFEFTKGGETDDSTDTRNHFIELGLEYFALRPYAGYGVGCFETLPGAFGTYSHNNYIELLFSVGIPGTLVYYSMYLYLLLKGVKIWIENKSEFAILSISIVIICLFMDYAMVSYFDRPTYFLIALIGQMLTLSRYQQKA